MSTSLEDVQMFAEKLAAQAVSAINSNIMTSLLCS